MINHPLFPFMAWNSDMAPTLVSLGVRLKVGYVVDLEKDATLQLMNEYDRLSWCSAATSVIHHFRPTPMVSKRGPNASYLCSAKTS